MAHLRTLRLSRGLTIVEVAQRSGLSARIIAELEHGLRPLDAVARRSLAHLYELAPDDLKPSPPVPASLSWDHLAKMLSQQLIHAALLSTLVAAMLFGGAIYGAELRASIASQRPLPQTDGLHPPRRAGSLPTPLPSPGGKANTRPLHNASASSPLPTGAPSAVPAAMRRLAPIELSRAVPTEIADPIPAEVAPPVPADVPSLAPAEVPPEPAIVEALPSPAEAPPVPAEEPPAPVEIPAEVPPAPVEAPTLPAEEPPAPVEIPAEVPPAAAEAAPTPTGAPFDPPAMPQPGARGNDVAAFAMQFVGARYAWSGADPSGFDCSGFTQYVYRHFGVELPRVAVDQYSDRYGTIVTDPSGLEPGDLVFFANTYAPGITHVGIYVGNSDVVQAMSPQYGVAIGNLNEEYWAQHYYGALRPLR